MLILIMILMISVFNYPSQINAIYCASGSLSNLNDIRNELCKADGEFCLIALSRKSINDHFIKDSLKCWPWPELEDECPSEGGICRVLHTSVDNLHGTCCCRGNMCNMGNLTIIMSPSKSVSSANYQTDLEQFGLRATGQNSRQSTDPQQQQQLASNLDHSRNLPNKINDNGQNGDFITNKTISNDVNNIIINKNNDGSTIDGGVNHDVHRADGGGVGAVDDDDDDIIISQQNHINSTVRHLRLLIIFGIILSVLLIIGLLMLCLSLRYKNVKLKLLFTCLCHPQTVQSTRNVSTTRTNLDNQLVNGSLKFLDCLQNNNSDNNNNNNNQKRSNLSLFKPNHHCCNQIRKPFTNHTQSHNKLTSDLTQYDSVTSVPDKLLPNSFDESTTMSEFIFYSQSEQYKSNNSDITNSEIIAKLCEKERLLGRGRFAEVWLAFLPDSVLNFNPIHSEVQSNQQSECQTTSQPVGISFEHEMGNIESHPPSLYSLYQLLNGFPSSTTDVLTHCTNQHSHPNHNSLNNQYSEFYLKDNHLQSDLANNDKSNLEDVTKTPLLSSDKQFNANISDRIHYRIPVAVKSFSAGEFGAWKTELNIFRILHRHQTTINNYDLRNAYQLYKLIGHPNIVLLLAAGSVQHNHQSSSIEYRLVMEFAEFGSLRQHLSDGRWYDFSHVVSIATDITKGLAYLHSEQILRQGDDLNFRPDVKYPIAHRDLKPENILRRSDGSCCLSDFGQSVCLANNLANSHIMLNNNNNNNNNNSSSVDLLNQIYSINSNFESVPKAGTFRYQAPEILDGAISFTGSALLRTDIYSLGLILWELLTMIWLSDYGVCELSHLDSSERATTLLASKFVDSTVTNNDGIEESDHNKPSQHGPHHQESPIPRRRHWLPYEKELGSMSNSPPALQQIVCVDKIRPISNTLWNQSTLFCQFYKTITECWDPDPEARLTAECILERIRSIEQKLYRTSTVD